MEKEQINIDTQELMTYNRQGIAGETSVLPSIEEIQGASDLTLDDRQHTVIDFLKRPVDVINTNLTWTSEQEQSQELIPTGIRLPGELFDNPMLREKLRGFLGIKGTIRARIMMNAQKFQQGILMAYWIPNYENMTTKAKMIQKSIQGKSGCPHITINCEGGTEQTIDIPYVNQHIFYNLATGQGNYGRLFLTPLLPLTAPTATSVGIRIQMWMEDPQPQFATSAPLYTPDYVSSQSVSQIEEKNMHPHDSGSLNKGGGLDVGRIWDAVKQGGSKPSYLSRSAANVMQLMGFQKPTQHASISRVNVRPGSYMANFNGEFMGHKCALASENEVMHMPAPAGTSEDEMALQHIIKTPTFYKNFRVNTLSSSTPSLERQVVWHDFVHPMKFVPTLPIGVLNSTFLGYVASSFAQWRGGLKYNFSVAKTGFHSGTLRVSFVPGVYDIPEGVPNLETNPQWQLERCYQETFDLRDKTDFSFTVPFPATRPYLNCINPFDHAALAVNKRNWGTGRLVVDVFIPAVAPPTVADHFDVAVWISGDDDLTFANPIAPSVYPYSPVEPTFVQSQSFANPSETDRVQASHSTNQKCNKSRTKNSFTASAYCTGEVIASVKALCGRFGPYYMPGNLPNTTSIILAPFDFSNPLLDTTSVKMFDYIDYFSYLYAFYAGGLRFIMDSGNYNPAQEGMWKIGMRSSLNAFYPMGTIQRASSILTSLLPAQYIQGPSSLSLARPSLEGLIEFEVPYYNLTHITPVMTADQTQLRVQESNYPLPIITLTPRYSAGVAANINYNPQIYRACADDFRFMYLLGPPQVVLLPAALDAIPIQYDNVKYSPTAVTRTDNDFAGVFGVSSFPVDTEPPGQSYKPASQFLAISANNTRVWCLPTNTFYKFYQSGDNLKVTSTAWNGANDLNLWSTAPTLTYTQGEGFTIPGLVSVAVSTPNPGFTQAAPIPCINFGMLNMTENINRTSITIPNQGVAIYGDLFTLNTYMIVFSVTDENLLESAHLLAPQSLIEIRRKNIEGDIYGLLVVDVFGRELGYIATELIANVGFPEGETKNALTEAEKLY